MNIKSIQNLVSDAMNEIKTIDVNEAYQMTKDNNISWRGDKIGKMQHKN